MLNKHLPLVIVQPWWGYYYNINSNWMTQQNYKLNELSSVYKKIEKDKNKFALKALEFVLQINKTIGFDQILIREGYESYPERKKLEQKKVYKEYQQFFTYMKKELQSIEANYLKNTNDIKLIGQAENNNQGQFNFLLNKNNISKFIRDQTNHYQKVLDKYLQEMPDLQQQKGIHTNKWHSFFMELFSNKYVLIIKDNQMYLERTAADVQMDMGNILKIYAKEVRDASQKQSESPFYITEENVLDFLTFWLKKESSNNLFVVYARTKARLNQESQFITGQTQMSGIHLHPSRMTSQQIVLKQKQLQEQQRLQILNKLTQVLIETVVGQEQPVIEVQEEKKVQVEEIRTTQIKQQQKFHEDRVQEVPVEKKHQPTNEQLLQAQLKSLFDFGCKRRYAVTKFTTFQEIESQSKTMTVQKFINFCSYFDLLSIITKELLIEYFKITALNCRTLDFPRFQKIVNKMVKVDIRILQNLLQKSKFDKKLKSKHMRVDKKNENPLSHYKFMLYPINGKDLSSMEKDISYKRLEKIIVKEERDKRVLERKQQLVQENSMVLKETTKDVKREIKNKRGMQRNYSQMRKMGNSRVSHLQLQNVRDNSFNPEKFITINDNDKLWQAYEAKIWKKQQNSKSALESILSKRIQKGTIVLNKLNSQRSFVYD